MSKALRAHAVRSYAELLRTVGEVTIVDLSCGHRILVVGSVGNSRGYACPSCSGSMEVILEFRALMERGHREDALIFLEGQLVQLFDVCQTLLAEATELRTELQKKRGSRPKSWKGDR